MNTSNRRSDRLAGKSTTNNIERESIQYSLQADADLLNINNTINTVSSFQHNTLSTNNNTHHDSNNLIDFSNQSPAFQLYDYVLFKNNPASITNIIRPDDPFKDDTFVITNNTGMSKTVTVDQIQLNNIPRNIVFPSPSTSLQSTEVICKSNFTKKSTVSSQSLEIINKLKLDLHKSNHALKTIKISSKTNNTDTSSYPKFPIAQPINNLCHSVTTVPVTKLTYTTSAYHSVNQPTPNNFDLTQLESTIATTVSSSTSTHVLKLPTFNLNDSKSFLQSVIVLRRL